MNSNFIYLHGFASGPLTHKGLFFQEKFKNEFQRELKIPDLNVPSFEKMSVSEQINQIKSQLDDSKSNILIGSSFGAYLAILINELHPNKISQMFLIAPAINMASRTLENMKIEEISAWKQSNQLEVEHFYYKTRCQLHYGFIDECLKSEKNDYQINCKTLIFHGTLDTQVPISLSEKFLSTKKNCTLFSFDSDHQMHDKLDDIWKLMKDHLRI